MYFEGLDLAICKNGGNHNLIFKTQYASLKEKKMIIKNLKVSKSRKLVKLREKLNKKA